MIPSLLAHGGVLCPDEILAGLTAAGAVGGMGWWVSSHWRRLKRGIGFRLIALHLRRCHGECNFPLQRYSVLAPR